MAGCALQKGGTSDKMQIFANILLAVLIFISIVLVIGVVMLPPKSQGVGAAIGGEETNIFGRRKSYGKTAMIEKLVDYSAIIFMVVAFVYNIVLKFV